MGIFCCVSTECFSVTKRVILYHWTVGFILLLLVTLLSRRYKAIDNSILPLILLMNLVNFDSICASHFYLILNLSMIIIACVFLYKKDTYIINFSKFREIADAVGAKLMVDMAHIAGLVAAGLHPSPVP